MTTILILLTGLSLSLGVTCFRKRRKLLNLWGERRVLELGMEDNIGLGHEAEYNRHRTTTRMIAVSVILMSILELGFFVFAGMSVARIFTQ